jgi:quercetin dioxygenase-like cupin family protein
VSEPGAGAVVVRLDSIRPLELASGVVGHPFFGTGLMLNLIDAEKEARVDRHRHPHEQMGLVLSGMLWLEIARVEHRLVPGDAFLIPGGVEHAARAGSGGCPVLDVFAPVRENLRERWERAG